MKTQRFAQIGQLVALSCAVALVVVLAGCGGSSGSTSNPWSVVSTTHNKSANYGILRGTVGQPSQVEVTVVTKPSVKARTHYTIACGPADYDGAKNKSGPTGATPLTFRITVPVPQAGPASCDVEAGADYPSDVETTITLLQRDAPTTTTTP